MAKFILTLLCLCLFSGQAAAAKRIEDVSYGPDAAQKMDVYIPQPASGGRPVIVMVHGGGWKTGDKANRGVADIKAGHYLPEGYIFVSINYRLLPGAGLEEQAKDVAAAVEYVHHHAQDWGGAPEKIILMGHSAGAHLSALASAPGGLPVLGTIALDSAVIDVASVMNRRHMNLYDEPFGSDPAYWAKTSPFENLKSGAKPFLLVCSGIRRDKPCLQAEKFASKAQSMGVETQVLKEPLSHEEINKTLGRPGDYTIAVDRFITGLLK